MSNTADDCRNLDEKKHDTKLVETLDERILKKQGELIFLLDDDQNIIWTSDSVTEFFDVEEENIVDNDLVNFLSSCSKDITAGELKKNLKSDGNQCMKMKLADEEKFTFHSHKFIVPPGDFNGVIAFLNPIGNESKVYYPEAIYKKLFEKNPLPSLLIDPVDYSILEFNERLTRFLGYSENELFDMKIIDFIEPSSAIDLTDRLELLSEERDCIFNIRMILKNGEVESVDLKYVPVIFSGKLVLYIWILPPSEREGIYSYDNDLNSILMVLRNINQLILRCDDVSYLVQSTCDMLYDLKGIKDVSVGLLKGDDIFRQIGHSGDNDVVEWAVKRKPGDEKPEWLESILESKITEIRDPDEGECKICGSDTDGFHRSIISPLKEEDLIGFMTICLERSENLEDIEKYLLSSIPSMLGYAIGKIKSDQERDRYKNRCRSLLDINPHPLFIIDNRGIITEMNDALHEELGLKRDKIVGNSLGEVNFLSSEGKNVILSCFLEPEDRSDENRFIDLKMPSGDFKTFEVNSRFFKNEGKILGAVELLKRVDD